MVDLHKEIKLSDLFKRGSKDPDEPKAEKPPKEPRRQKKEKPPKEKRPSRFKRAKEPVVTAHEAPPLLEIPLMRAFNLLPGEEARADQEKRSPVPYVLVALAGVLLFAGLASFYLMAGMDATDKQSRIDDLRAELARYTADAEQPQAEDPTEALAAERLGRTNALSAALGTRLAWDRVLRELALVLPEDATIDSIEATSPGAYNAPQPTPDGAPIVHFKMLGGAESHASVAEVLARLSVIPEFENVELKISRRAETDTAEDTAESTDVRHPYTFEITAMLRLGQ
jgi:Tfp pilus assembly protein PilN